MDAPLEFQPSLFDGAPVAFDRTFAAPDRIALDGQRWVEHAPGWVRGSDVLFDQVLRSRDGRDGVAWHADRISNGVVDPVIALVSLGEPRRFLLRPKGGGPSIAFWLGRGDLLVTGGAAAAPPLSPGAMSPARRYAEVLSLAGREVTISNPGKLYFPKAGVTKLELVRYYLAVAEGALRAVRDRPMALKRYVDGAEGEFFFQKRAPESRPDWIDVVELRFPSGRAAQEVVVRDAAQLAWVVNLGCIDLNPHPVRAADLDHPDELRIDLDPGPGVGWEALREVAAVAREVLREHALAGWPKTSGSRGVHVHVRIAPRWTFTQVRDAALALAREVERRVPALATSRWWKEERHGVFIDYNQNAKDRTVASAYSVRPVPDARVSAPVTWDELAVCDPADFTLRTMPARFGALGDVGAGIDGEPGSLEPLLELSARQRADGLGDAPWPPHYAKGEEEPRRVQPSRRKGAASLPGLAAAGAGAPPADPRAEAPLLAVAKARHQEDALAGLARWRLRHPEAARHLAVDDVLVDAMRGRSSTWTRVRVSLRHVPEAERPPEEPPDPDYDPWTDGSPKMRDSS